MLIQNIQNHVFKAHGFVNEKSSKYRKTADTVNFTGENI